MGFKYLLTSFGGPFVHIVHIVHKQHSKMICSWPWLHDPPLGQSRSHRHMAWPWHATEFGSKAWRSFTSPAPDAPMPMARASLKCRLSLSIKISRSPEISRYRSPPWGSCQVERWYGLTRQRTTWNPFRSKPATLQPENILCDWFPNTFRNVSLIV